MSGFTLRPRARVNYFEPEEPSPDECVFCEKCGDYVFEYCSIHGPLLVIPDHKVPARGPWGVPRAALSVPRTFLHLAPSLIPDAGIGVFATLTLPRGVRFGPYRGQRSLQVDSAYCWQIYDRNNRPAHVVDAADADRSNWMRYVNCARHSCEQNLVAFQYRGELYYRTIKIIPRFTELMVFYGTEFAHSLGVDVRRYNSPSGYVRIFEAPAPKNLKLDTQIGTAAEHNPRSVETQKAGIEAKVPGAQDSNHAITPSPPVHNIATATQQCKRRKTKFVTPKKKDTKTEKKTTFVTPRKPQTKSKSHTFPKRRKVTAPNEPVQDNTPKPSVCEDRASNIEEPKANGINHFVETQNTNKFESKTVKDKACEDSSTNDTNTDCVSDSIFTCNVCSKQFNTKSSLIQHLHSHNSYFFCNECSYNTVSRDTFEKHLHLHDKSRPHQCDECSNRYTTKQHLQTHVSRVHRKDRVSIKRHSCDICDYKTDDIRNLKDHLNMHAGIKPYSCTVCTYKCIQRSTLKAHIRTHTGEKPFSCSVCTYVCRFKSSLIIHERKHTGELYSCSICTYKCIQRSNLKVHEKTHTG